MKPVCVHCKQFYKPKHTGIWVLEQMPTHIGIKPGVAEGWKPYNLWRADLYECAGCSNQLITGFAHQPITRHFQPNFQEVLTRVGDYYLVNDC